MDKEFVVFVYEVEVRPYLVKAKDEEEAREKYDEGEATLIPSKVAYSEAEITDILPIEETDYKEV